MRAKVLVVDDELDMLENCQRLLARAGHEVKTLADPTTVPARITEFAPDVMLLDLRMPQADGLTVLAAALALDPALPVVIMTAFSSVDSAVRAIREGAFDYLTKPFTSDQLIVAVDRALRYRGLSLENLALRQQVGADGPATARLIGGSRVMAHVMAQVRRAAPTEANLLILGESGTGKELLARAVHELSNRRAGPFVPIDCTSLPANLLESELFGHERGAFTGAIARKTGLLAEANGGTVFLDEIGELELPLQAKLLRALEERQVRSVGGTSQSPIDVRVLAATNVDLEAAVKNGHFRSDLYFRLNVVQITLPPLRARLGDLTELLNHFLAEFARGGGRAPPRVSPEALEAIEAYQWPGNVRELRNVAQHLVVLDDDGRITMADLPETIRGWPAGAARSFGPPPAYESAREQAQTDFLRRYVRDLLDYHGGNVSRAAAAAGVSRRTLHRWLVDIGGPAADRPS